MASDKYAQLLFIVFSALYKQFININGSLEIYIVIMECDNNIIQFCYDGLDYFPILF